MEYTYNKEKKETPKAILSYLNSNCLQPTALHWELLVFYNNCYKMTYMPKYLKVIKLMLKKLK